MPSDETDDALAAQQHASQNRREIDASDRCGCFHCCTVFRPAQVIAWIRNDADTQNDTARCPHCGIDAVLGSASGLPIAAAFLTRVRQHWYRR